MKDRLLDCLKIIYENEGGFSDVKQDKGGATKYGITIQTLADFRGIPQTKNDVKNLTKFEATAIYRSKYWNKLNLDLSTSFNKSLIIFDQGINKGVKTVSLQVQKLLNETFGARLKEDGSLGPISWASINKTNEEMFCTHFLEVSKEHYLKIIENDFTQSVFKKGWMNRLEHLKANLNFDVENLKLKKV